MTAMGRGMAKLMIFALMLTLLGWGAPAAADTLVYESWAVYEHEGRPVGMSHDVKWETAEGYRYVVDLVLQMGLPGGPPMIITQYKEQVIDKNLLAKAMKQVLAVDKKTQYYQEATFTGADVYLLTRDAEGKEYESQWIDAGPLYFRQSFLDMIAVKGELKPGTSHTFDIWDINKAQPGTVTILVEEAEPYEYYSEMIPVVCVRELDSPINYMLVADDGSGNVYFAVTEEANLNLKLTGRTIKPEDIPELQALEIDILQIPANMFIARPFQSITSSIKLSWTDLPIEEFNLEDNRQKLLRHEEKEGRIEAWVQINRDDRDFTSAVTLPVKDEDLKPYLAGTRFVEPHLPEVQELLPQIIKGETDGFAVAKAILDWVFDYITPVYISQTLTTGEILSERQGKCVEYAVLFAALARAAGLPCRLALGERYQDGAWIGHMWNEVWLGEWVAVDPSHKQINPDALLLKLVHSESVEGTQKVRRGLIGRLQIEILDVELPVQERMEGFQTGIEGSTYTDVEYGFQVSAPEEWWLDTALEQNVLLVTMLSPDKNGEAYVIPFSVPAGIPPQQILTGRVASIAATVSNFSMDGITEENISSLPATVGTWTYEYGGLRWKQQNWIVLIEDLGYLFVFTTLEDVWEDYSPAFAAIRQSFRLLGRTESGSVAGQDGEATEVAEAMTREQRWLEDLDYLAQTLPASHVQLFAHYEEAEFYADIERLKSGVGTLSDVDIYVALAKVFAKIGDTHTQLRPMLSWRTVPVQFMDFADGVYPVAWAAKYGSLAGLRLVAVGDTPFSEVQNQLSTIIPHDNQAQLQQSIPNLLSNYDLLLAMGFIADTGVIPYLLESADGTRRLVEMKVEAAAGLKISRAFDATTVPVPLYLSRNDWFWYQYLEVEQVLYIQYNVCWDRETERQSNPQSPRLEQLPDFAAFSAEVLAVLENNPVAAVVLDLRNNQGGNSYLGTNFIGSLAEHPKVRDGVPVFGIIGRSTFSSALMNALDMKKILGSPLYGQPTAGKPNHFGEVKTFNLPHSKWQVQYSTKYFKLVAEDVDSLYPDVHVAPTFADYASGRDPVLEKIIAEVLR